MQKYILRAFSDVTINHVGKEVCSPGHSFGYCFKEDFLIHYVVSGKGKFVTEGKEYNLKEGNAFFIGNQKGIYTADDKEPWTYIWINFSGIQMWEFLKKLNLNSENPVYYAKDCKRIEKCFEEFADIDLNKNEYYIYSRFFYLLSEMLECSENKTEKEKISSDKYINICREYVKFNYMKKISAADLAQAAMIEYSYLFRLFKEKLGISPGKYIINYKMKKAAMLLRKDNLTVSQTAYEVGYEDRSAFSKLFKQKYGVSPDKWKKSGTAK